MPADPAGATDPMLPRPFVVRRVTRETAETSTLVLDPADGESFPFVPGQFTMLGRPGYGEVPVSISGDPARPGYLEHTVRAVGDASAAIARARRGDRLLARGPYGNGWGVADGAGGDIVVVAGGLGLAPLRPAIFELLARREMFRRVFVFYGGRTPGELLYRNRLQRWGSRPDVDVAITVDVATPSWRGHVGVVTSLLAGAGIEPASTLALICGPEVMMRLTVDALRHRGVPPDRIRLSMERNMKCGVGLCGHCQLRELFVCLDGPVFGYDRVADLLPAREI